MIQLQSPNYSNSSKTDLFCKQRSPSMRKRIPSMQECLSSHQLKISKGDSPSEIRRRKSQHDSQNLNGSNGKKQRPKTGNNCTQDLITSIQDLKDQYKALREAYKELVQEKMKNSQELNTAKQLNLTLKNELEQVRKSENSLKEQVGHLESELKAERRAKQQLQTDLYFLKERAALGSSEETQKTIEQPKFPGNDQIQQICCRSFSSESNILSFSLTSVLEESLYQDKTSRKREHVKVVSNLPNFNSDFENIELKPKKESLGGNFKKNKKESLKIELAEAKEAKEGKPLAALNPLSQLLSLKSPLAADKKPFKAAIQNSSNSKRRKQDKENVEPKGIKKKSKKLLLQTPPE